ncbi:unnamed protein product [Vicia faba]|uniref:Non-haem dioxygenase N-terminal domain-containing protein n=1 Tax=Vicia faba TaxID=3906 RepID=A0AAV1AQ98_VICFA|nr:unnamed protein product [Vicia faba]CAI8612508.1 unnamed protein product [Vicia faba]CAI8612509.1 unnamed protein product [Vicia faba]
MDSELNLIDISPYLAMSGECDQQMTALCYEVSQNLREKGALLLKDPRCTLEDNDRFVAMVEKYFSSSLEFKLLHQRPQLHYQVGVTPEGIEVPRSLVDKKMKEEMKKLSKENRPSAPLGADLKWRYFWRPNSCSQPVIPEGFPEWEETMNSWGQKMMAAIEVVAEMTAIGFNLPKDSFTSLMKQGPHLLAPTGSDLEKYGKEGTVLAGYHYDLNFLTIHGRSNYPGLNVWLRNGKKIPAKVPFGCLLVQTGKQMEWLTGGECIASMHDLVVTNQTIDAISEAQDQKRCFWRVSSTLFAHIASDQILKPLGYFERSPLAIKYPPIIAEEYVEEELKVIHVKANK